MYYSGIGPRIDANFVASGQVLERRQIFSRLSSMENALKESLAEIKKSKIFTFEKYFFLEFLLVPTQKSGLIFLSPNGQMEQTKVNIFQGISLRGNNDLISRSENNNF